jgi:hypothetical protein
VIEFTFLGLTTTHNYKGRYKGVSQCEVNEIKNHVNQLVLGSAQTYINKLKEEILRTVHLEITGLADRVENRVTEFEEGLKLEVPRLHRKLDKIQESLDDITEGLQNIGRKAL